LPSQDDIFKENETLQILQNRGKIYDSVWSWVIMIFIGFSLIGAYFCYDFPAAFEDKLKDKFGIDNS
jgi:hypothetical protein